MSDDDVVNTTKVNVLNRDVGFYIVNSEECSKTSQCGSTKYWNSWISHRSIKSVDRN